MAVAVSARKGRFLLVALMAAHLVAISHQVDGGQGTSLLQRGLFALLYPFEWAVAASVRSLRNGAASYVDLRRVREDNARLRGQLSALETLLQEKQDRVREADRLRAVLGLKEVLPLQTLVALVVARDGLPFYRMLTIDRGSADGVKEDAPVISPTGVVGRVIRVFPRAASVQLLLDAQSGVGVLIDRTRVMGVASGRSVPSESGVPDLEMRYVPALADVTVGDVVVTSGLDGIFPKGLAVGRVRAVGEGTGLFKDVRVEPSARFSTLEEVLVLLEAAPEIAAEGEGAP